MAQMNGKRLPYHHPLYRSDIERMARLPLPWNCLDGARVLVSGASGLIGSMLTDTLAEACAANGMTMHATVLGRNAQTLEERFQPEAQGFTVSAVQQDLRLPLSDGIKGRKFDAVFHLASSTHPALYASDPVGTILLSVNGTHSLLEAAKKGGCRRFVHASSVDIYGEQQAGAARFRESDGGFVDCNTVRACYTESKRLCEALCRSFQSQEGLPVVIPRLCRIYGPTMRMDDTKVSSQFIKNALNGEDIIMKSEGTQRFSFLHCADAVSALLHIYFYGKDGEAYNVADERSDCTLAQLAGLCAKESGLRVKRGAPGDIEKNGCSPVRQALLDSSKLKELGWSAKYGIEEGIRQTLTVLREVHP